MIIKWVVTMTATENKRGFRHYGRHIPGLNIPSFKTALKWRGADLQTLRNTIVGPSMTLTPDFERVSFSIDGGHILKAAYHPSLKSDVLPVIIIIHGLAGDETSANVISSAAYFISLGFPVLRLNLRGAGPSAETSVGPYHGGLSADLAQVVTQAQGYGAGVVLYGISLGGNMMLKYLGEQGTAAPVRAAIAVSAPLCLKTVQIRLMESRNRLYHNYLLLGMRNYAKQMAGQHEADLIARARAAKSLYEFDDQFTAPAHGMSGAEEYYRLNSAQKFIDHIRVPTLIIHARNDPWIPVEDYLARSWNSAGAISLLIAEDGGHVGFHGKGHAVPWHERVAAEFMGHMVRQEVAA